MKRTFLFSFMAGLALMLAAAAIFPLPSHERFPSRIEVQANGGRAESFLVHWPEDRLVLRGELDGVQLQGDRGLAVLASAAGPAAVELFRLRDADDHVIGMASRVTAVMPGPRGRDQSTTNWTLVIPSRGMLFLSQENGADVGPVRIGNDWVPAVDAPGFWATGRRYRISAGPAPGGRGRVVDGTGEFAALGGEYTEVWELEELRANGDSKGAIRLATVVAKAQ